MSLLDKAMVLYTLHYVMGRNITYSPRSGEKVIQHLRKPTSRAYESNLISRLLSRQIKSAMHSLLREVTRDLLEDMEKDLRTRSRTTWAPCFCVISILCMCIEEVQIATNGFTLHTQVHGPHTNHPSSEATIEICRRLDDLPFVHLMELFHGIYKTQRPLTVHRNEHVYNPIRDGPEAYGLDDAGQNSIDLVNDIRKIIKKHGKCSSYTS